MSSVDTQSTSRHKRIALCSGRGWTASVAFSGVGRTPEVDVGEWLAERTKAFTGGVERDFEALVDSLTDADVWLSKIPRRDLARHSFAIGAFVADQPTFVLISNFENPTDLVADLAAPVLTVYRQRPRRPHVFVSGQKLAVLRAERRRIAALAARDVPPERIHAALADLNSLVATSCSTSVSSACFTTYVGITGDAAGQPHGLEGRPFFPTFAIPEGFESVIRKLVRDQFGPDSVPALRQMSMARADATDDYHAIQLRERPNDANVHCNYGAYLKDVMADEAGARREYSIALALDPGHVNSLGNFANLRWEQGQTAEARSFYEQALASDSGNENVTWNFARLLMMNAETEEASDLIDAALELHPDNGRLHLLRAEIHLLAGQPDQALRRVDTAREHHADQSTTESLAAVALHISGRPASECVGAYRVAIALAPENGMLHLNLAQLLFILGDDSTARYELRQGMALGLDDGARLEAGFYRLAHTDEIEDAARNIETQLGAGVRLLWDVRPNIERVGRSDPDRAEVLTKVAAAMAPGGDVARFRGLVEQLLRPDELHPGY